MSPVDALVETVSETSTKPVKVFRDRNLSVSVFRNKATVRDEERVFHNSYVQRSYKEDDGFKTTSALGKDDLPRVQLLVAQAWSWIVEQEAALKKAAK